MTPVPAGAAHCPQQSPSSRGDRSLCERLQCPLGSVTSAQGGRGGRRGGEDLAWPGIRARGRTRRGFGAPGTQATLGFRTQERTWYSSLVNEIIIFPITTYGALAVCQAQGGLICKVGVRVKLSHAQLSPVCISAGGTGPTDWHVEALSAACGPDLLGLLVPPLDSVPRSPPHRLQNTRQQTAASPPCPWGRGGVRSPERLGPRRGRVPPDTRARVPHLCPRARRPRHSAARECIAVGTSVLSVHSETYTS